MRPSSLWGLFATFASDDWKGGWGQSKTGRILSGFGTRLKSICDEHRQDQVSPLQVALWLVVGGWWLVVGGGWWVICDW